MFDAEHAGGDSAAAGMNQRRGRKRFKGTTGPAPVPPRRTDWTCEQSTGRIVWQNLGDTRLNSWSGVGFSFVLLVGLTLLVTVPILLLMGAFAMVAALVNDTPMSVVWTVGTETLLAFVVMALLCGSYAFLLIFVKDIDRLEFDLIEQRIVLHEVRFPNRRRIVAIPFAQVTGLHPFKLRSSAGASFSVNFTHGLLGRETDRLVGDNLPLDMVHDHLEQLRPALGNRIGPLSEYDD